MRLIVFFCLLISVGCYADRPNVVYLLLDDLDEVVTAPFLATAMPFTMALTSHGVTFKSNYSGVICCESRSSILTGLHAHNSGVFTNGGDYGGYAAFRKPKRPDGQPMLGFMNQPLDNEYRTFPFLLTKKGGYRTIMIGKYMNGFDEVDGKLPAVPVGWTDGDAGIDNNLYRGYGYALMHWSENAAPRKSEYGNEEKDYATDVIFDRATAFLDRREREKDSRPFLMYLAPTAPHLPLKPAKQDENFSKQWENSLPKNRPNFFTDDGFEDKPKWLELSHDERSSPLMRLWVEKDWHQRLGSLYSVDRRFKALYKKLAALGELDNTVFILTSDNGYNLGAHSLIHKMAPYQESVRVPLFIFGGKATGIKRGEVSKHLTLHLDHAPTILALAGVPVPSEMDGASLVPFLQGAPPVSWRKDLLQQYEGGKAANGIGKELPPAVDYIAKFMAAPPFFLDIPTHASLHAQVPGPIDRTFVYISWPGLVGLPEEELYELSNDPYQLTNLLFKARPACRQVADAMKARLEEQRKCSGNSCRDGEVNWPSLATARCK